MLRIHPGDQNLIPNQQVLTDVLSLEIMILTLLWKGFITVTFRDLIVLNEDLTPVRDFVEWEKTRCFMTFSYGTLTASTPENEGFPSQLGKFLSFVLCIGANFIMSQPITPPPCIPPPVRWNKWYYLMMTIFPSDIF